MLWRGIVWPAFALTFFAERFTGEIRNVELARGAVWLTVRMAGATVKVARGFTAAVGFAVRGLGFLHTHILHIPLNPCANARLALGCEIVKWRAAKSSIGPWRHLDVSAGQHAQRSRVDRFAREASPGRIDGQHIATH